MAVVVLPMIQAVDLPMAGSPHHEQIHSNPVHVFRDHVLGFPQPCLGMHRISGIAQA